MNNDKATNFLFKSNNWLKRHHIPMRRKPFKIKRLIHIDEGYRICSEENSVFNSIKVYSYKIT